MNPDTVKVACTSTRPHVFGKMCRVTISRLEMPSARAASTNCICLYCNVRPRTKRISGGQPSTAKTTVITITRAWSPRAAATGQPDGDAKHGGDHGPNETDDESGPQAVDHSAEQVVTIAVGAQEMLAAGPG